MQATHTALYLSQFLASLARQSEHKFSSRAAEEAAVVYNYDVFFTGWDISVLVRFPTSLAFTCSHEQVG